MPPKLMIPGPVDVEAAVLDMLAEPVQAHYGDEWVAIHNETLELLRQVFVTEGRVYMLPGSGSLAADAVIHSMFKPGDRIALGINGFFGIRWREIIEANGMTPVVIETPLDQPLDPAAFDRLLAEDPSIAGVAAVQLETSTALLNPIRAIAQVTRKHDKLFVVDAVSGLAGAEYRMDEWGVDATVSGSQKGLGGVAGIGLAALNDRAWAAVEQAGPARSWYLDLRRWEWYVQNWADWHPFPITMPCSVILALRVALQSLLAEGLDNRLRRCETLAQRLRAGLVEIGMELFIPETLMSPVLTAAYCPPGAKSADVVRFVAEQHNIKITAGFGAVKDQVVRIGHMGAMISENDIDRLLDALRHFVDEYAAQAARPDEG
jgi:alanine-glyoxylate transaminase / serine-glyoxylate transaminase / serine-pyruvate transaminase